MSGSKRMRAVAVAAPGGPEQLVVIDAERPTPGVGEVLVAVAAAGVNRPDVLQREGRYPAPPGASPLLGLEVAGVVVATGGGDCAGLTPGDRVTALAPGGGYAEFCVVPAPHCLPWPRGYDAVRAAALPETLFTVWANLFEPRERNGADLRAGETVLVHGGTSGIGTAATGLARARGSRVIVTVGSDDKCAAARRHGAAHAINYRDDPDWPATARALTDGSGVDVVLDMVGGPYLAGNLAVLAPGGRLSLIGQLGGATAPAVDLTPVMTRRLTITGSTLRPRSLADKSTLAAALRREVWPLLDDGAFAPVIEATFPLDRAADAHRLMESSRHVGKIVLVPDGDVRDHR